MRDRLIRRGVVPSAVAWGTSGWKDALAVDPDHLAQATAWAATSPVSRSSRVVSTISSSVRFLIEQELKAMILTKIKLGGASVLALGLVAATAGVIAQSDGNRPRRGEEAAEAQDTLKAQQPLELDRSLRKRDLGDRIRALEAALAQTRSELEQLESAHPAARATPATGASPDQASTPSDMERRLTNIERKLEELLVNQATRPTLAQLPPAAPAAAQVDDEDRPKFEAWALLVRDGFLGRFDTGTTNALQLYTKLHRRYVGRRPTAEEVDRVSSMFGPGYERSALAPEEFVRRLFETESFAETALGRALFSGASAPKGAESRSPGF
jgi:hypothetical protein